MVLLFFQGTMSVGSEADDKLLVPNAFVGPFAAAVAVVFGNERV